MSDSTCLICKREASVSSYDDVHRIECETCGNFEVTREVKHSSVDLFSGDTSYVLSAITRQSSDAGRLFTITLDNASTLLQSTSVPTSPLDKLDRALLYVSERQRRFDDYVDITFENDYPLIFSNDGEEFQYFLDTLVEKGILERLGSRGHRKNQRYRLKSEGWEKVEQLRKVQIDSDQAFVAMSFSDELMAAWKDGFEPALSSTGFKPFRVDLEEHDDKIDDLIISEIRRSGLMVADFTKHSNGVYFEAGFAMGLGIYVIRTCRNTDIDKLHFDTSHYNHIVWETPEDLQEKLINRITARIPGRVLPDSNS